MHLLSTLLSLITALFSYGLKSPEKGFENGRYQNNLFTYSAKPGPLVFLKSANGYPPSYTANSYIPANSSSFDFGTNMGYYGANWSDDQIAGIFKNVGGNSLRVSLPEKFLRQWGYGVRVNTFKNYRDNLGLTDLTATLEGPSDAVRDRTKFDGSNESNVFANLYQPIWNGDGSVNTNNYYANYIYNTVINYGEYVKYWEIWNEPDLSSANTDNWYSRNPTAAELPNLKAPISHYIRMLRIAYEVIKTYKPDDYIAIGGIGYDSFLDAVLRNTDNPGDGSVTGDYPNKGGAYFDVLSYHYYPIYSLKAWNNSISGFDYRRHSDAAVNETLNHKNLLEQTLKKYGYGSSYPQKHVIITETNVGRKDLGGELYGGNEYQLNYVMKMIVQAQKAGIKQVDFFMTGETTNYDQAYNENQVMGFYENLNRDAPGSQKMTPAGIGHKTLAQALNGYIYDSGLTAQLALPSNSDGAAFKKGNDVLYVLYAKTTTDKNESNITTYSFPSSMNVKTLGFYDWNYSITQNYGSVSGSTIQLKATPVIFRITETNQTAVAASSTPINYKYYETALTWWSLPDFSQYTPVSTGKTNNIDLSIPHRAENYGVVYESYINIPTTGNYTFETYSDDGTKLYVNNQTVVDNNGTHGLQYREGTIYLAQGSYPISLAYVQGGGGSGLQVYWKNTANGVTDRQVIPYSYFVEGAATQSASVSTLNYKYYETASTWWKLPDFNQITPTTTGKASDINLSVAKRAENYGILYEGFINIPVAGNYTFETSSDDGTKLYLGSYNASATPIVNNDGTHGMQFTEGTVNLSKGVYPIAVAYVQGGGGSGLEVYWKNTAHGVTSRQRIPKEYYVSGPATTTSFTKLSVNKNSLAVDAVNKTEKLAVSYTTGVYPNPVSNTVYVKLGSEFTNDSQVRLQLSDLSGHVLKTQNLTQANSSVEMDIQPLNLFTGMYFLKVSGDKVPAKTFKLIKK